MKKFSNVILIKTSFIISILGIFLIYILALTLEPRLISISSINQKSLDKFVKIQGYVVSPGIIEDKNKTYSFTVFKIQDNSSEINVYFEKPLKLNAFQQLEIIGKVSSYENQLQIQSYKLKILG